MYCNYSFFFFMEPRTPEFYTGRSAAGLGGVKHQGPGPWHRPGLAREGNVKAIGNRHCHCTYSPFRSPQDSKNSVLRSFL